MRNEKGNFMYRLFVWILTIECHFEKCYIDNDSITDPSSTPSTYMLINKADTGYTPYFVCQVQNTKWDKQEQPISFFSHLACWLCLRQSRMQHSLIFSSLCSWSYPGAFDRPASNPPEMGMALSFGVLNCGCNSADRIPQVSQSPYSHKQGLAHTAIIPELLR